MRRLLFILMIVLLPVRGWATDVMSVSMARQQLDAAQSTQSGSGGENTFAEALAPMQTSIPTDCPMMARLADPSASDASGGMGSPISKICASCQLCMALFTEQSDELMLLPFARHAPPVPRTVAFAGVVVASVFKPPIF